MKYRLKPTRTFEKNLKRLTTQEQKMVARKLKLMVEDPFYPSLRTKKIQGFNQLFECSINMDLRIIWKYEDGNLILMLDIGRHSLLNKL